MPTRIQTGESNVAVFYRITLPNGYTFVVASIPLDERSATKVLGNVTYEYSLICPIRPQGWSWPFLTNSRPSLDYVEKMTHLTGLPAKLLRHLLPYLTAVDPADDLTDAADKFYQEEMRP